MSLYRKNATNEALEALDRADKIAEQNRLDQEALQVSEQEEEESRKFDEEHGLTNATVAERIKYIQEKILTAPKGHILSTLAPQGRGLGEAIKTAPPKTHGHQQCSVCQESCFRLYDKNRSTTQKITWIDRVKCVRCGLEQPIKKEVLK